jgi:hydrogenase maturation protein HypF
VADLIVELSLRLRRSEGLNQVALSGGVFQNVTLLQQVEGRLRNANFGVLTHRLVPPNDGGLALGQAVIAGFQT